MNPWGNSSLQMVLGPLQKKIEKKLQEELYIFPL